jgi:hypothetical protein
VLLGDLEQHAPEVVRDERRDRRKEDSERLDETVGALVVGQVGGAERLADVRVEHRDRALGGPARGFVMPARQRQELGHRQTGLEETQPGGDDVDVGGREPGVAFVAAGNEEPLAHDRLDERIGHARPRRELVEREELLGAALGSAVLVDRADHGRRQRLVGAVELAGHDAADDGEREAPTLEVLDAGETLDVLGAVPGDAPPALGRREEPALLVEADRVDGDVGPTRQVLDPQLLRRSRSHDPRF